MQVRRPGSLRFFALGLAVLAAAPVLVATRRADALYRYYSRKNLAHALEFEPEKWIDSDVTVTDELAFVFPENAEADSDKVNGTKCIRFDTFYFRCAIDASKPHEHLDKTWEEAKAGIKDILGKIEDVNEQARLRKLDQGAAATQRKALYFEADARWRAKPLVTLFGKVTHADFFSPTYYVKETNNKPDPEAKATPEPITLLLERVEKPREKYYEFGLDEDND
jgi:hypothetical protein